LNSPQCSLLGLTLVPSSKYVIVRLPYADRLVGDPATGVLHGGVITTLIDSSCGLAAFAALPEYEMIATLDLRIDFLRAATPLLDVYCKAECYRMSRHVAFVRATAYQDDSTQPLAYSVGTFMRNSSALKKPEDVV
jgi:uncharacterized protein (TIGR00369 family)